MPRHEGNTRRPTRSERRRSRSVVSRNLQVTTDERPWWMRTRWATYDVSRYAHNPRTHPVGGHIRSGS